jgi:SEC-C motif/Protein of unknown function (DUF2384)
MESVNPLDDSLPAQNDLAGWKSADQRLIKRFIQLMKTDQGLLSTRAVKRYFGHDDLPEFFRKHEQQGVIMSYTAWAILDYRPNRNSKTRSERMLEEGLPRDEAILLRARMESHPTLWRIAGHNAKAGTVDLEDVLLGGSVVVHDRLMSEHIEDGLFLAARAFPAGNFHFIEFAGPPLGEGMGSQAAEYLQDCGVRFTRENLRRAAHVFGWLWDWIEQWEANRKAPRICNMDGDDLLWHTASFSLAEPEQIRSILGARDDIAYDEEADEYVWSRDASDDPRVPGDTITLGRIELLGDELVLSVNSARRLAAARKWLEKLPGVAFRNVVTRQWDEPTSSQPMDERIARPEPVKMTPELTDAVQESMTRMYMQWLDQPLPILGGKTPREACRSVAGRQQVGSLIRTIPDPMGPAPIRVPRQAMLRELGLADESSPTRSPAGPPSQAASPITSAARKVGRNEPCPCGSGKKYKKCCGR